MGTEYPPEQWEKIREEFVDLYISKNMTLKDIRDLFKTKKGFDASERQYKGKINKWKLKKNLSQMDKDIMLRHGLSSLNGRLVSHRLRRYQRREMLHASCDVTSVSAHSVALSKSPISTEPVTTGCWPDRTLNRRSHIANGDPNREGRHLAPGCNTLSPASSNPFAPPKHQSGAPKIVQQACQHALSQGNYSPNISIRPSWGATGTINPIEIFQRDKILSSHLTTDNHSRLMFPYSATQSVRVPQSSLAADEDKQTMLFIQLFNFGDCVRHVTQGLRRLLKNRFRSEQFLLVQKQTQRFWDRWTGACRYETVYVTELLSRMLWEGEFHVPIFLYGPGIYPEYIHKVASVNFDQLYNTTVVATSISHTAQALASTKWPILTPKSGGSPHAVGVLLCGLSRHEAVKIWHHEADLQGDALGTFILDKIQVLVPDDAGHDRPIWALVRKLGRTKRPIVSWRERTWSPSDLREEKWFAELLSSDNPPETNISKDTSVSNDETSKLHQILPASSSPNQEGQAQIFRKSRADRGMNTKIPCNSEVVNKG
ncbi:hypothetical protein K469DRAFT_704324 [Zopfia rhizophila CBS 207.26]|uniref:Clr5 domain-containing protein n=1 Tax=Zopfia rhizophila CBS 207.26 TaxID=1314779 RepID=A0A6A6EB72_9PEZI|nr:hypothetical protein K469DRAFT_704324 [Zopfia rhizophila CBS 207.26]